MKQEFSPLELIKFAISIEDDGVEFYEKNAEKVDGFNKTLLLKLANDEKQHAAVFTKMYDEFSAGNGDFDYLSDFDVEAMFRAYANHEVFNKRKQEVDSVDKVLEIAAETEKITVDYYTDLLPHAKGPLVEILERLIKEEQGHYDQIMELMNI